MLYIIYSSDEHQVAITELNEIRFFMNDLAENIEVLWGVYRDNDLGEQVKVTLIATDFAESKVSPKEEVSENEYRNTLMDMYYGNQKRKKHETIEEFIEDVPVAKPSNEELITEIPKEEAPKTKFLDKFLKKLGDIVEKIE